MYILGGAAPSNSSPTSMFLWLYLFTWAFGPTNWLLGKLTQKGQANSGESEQNGTSNLVVEGVSSHLVLTDPIKCVWVGKGGRFEVTKSLKKVLTKVQKS